MPGLVELREWLEEELPARLAELARQREMKPQNKYQVGWARGYHSALLDVQDLIGDLTSLDSSHDLPSTKG